MPNWWERGMDPDKGGDSKPATTEKNGVDSLGAGLRDGMGVGFVTISEGTIYPFMLSSAFTARNYGHLDKEEVELDILWAFVLSLITGGIIAYLLHSTVTIIYAFLLGLFLSFVYLVRGGLLKLPFNIPGLSPGGLHARSD